MKRFVYKIANINFTVTFYYFLNLKGRAIGLPNDFLYFNDRSRGGGVLQVKFDETKFVF